MPSASSSAPTVHGRRNQRGGGGGNKINPRSSPSAGAPSSVPSPQTGPLISHLPAHPTAGVAKVGVGAMAAAAGGAVARATVKGKYNVDKNAATAVATVAMNAGDVKLKASMTDATFMGGPSLSGLALSLERPGSFIIDYDVPLKDVRFQFMNTIKVREKPVSLTYIHFRGANRTTLDGTVTFDPANKVSWSYAFGTGGCKVKYAYAHGSLRRTLFEPSYDFSKDAWDFAVSRKFKGDDTLRASYETSKKNLKLEWSRDSQVNGTFKISASMDLEEEQKFPKLTAESTWNCDLF